MFEILVFVGVCIASGMLAVLSIYISTKDDEA